MCLHVQVRPRSIIFTSSSASVIVFYRVVDGRGSLSISATGNVSAAGIMAPKATALPTPITKRDAVIMGEMTVATD